jgi:ketoreductase RED2
MGERYPERWRREQGDRGAAPRVRLSSSRTGTVAFAAMSEFESRVVLVTGSSSGIGEAVAQRFSALGATVVVNSSSSVEAGEAVSAALPGESTYIRADISNQEEAHHLIDATVATYGHLDVLVNNAGWTTVVPHGDLDALTDEIFRKTFEVNVFGTWWLTKRAIPHLREVEDGNIVNITSIAGVRPVGSSMAYSMTKAALNQMTLLLAKSYGPIRVNAVAPGLVATPWTSDWDAQHAAVAGTAPVPRSATPDDCAEAVLALVRNRYASGEIFVVDGGLTQVM